MKGLKNKYFLQTKKYFFIFILIVLLFSIKLFYQNSVKNKLEISLYKGENFLGEADLYKETFGENHYCNDPNNNDEFCLYKRIDYSIDFIFIEKEFKKIDNKKLKERIKESDDFLKNIVSEWKISEIDFSYIDPSFEKRGNALDLYCILGLVYEDEKMFEKVNSSLKDDGWFNEDTVDKFRRITDESWCIMLLSKFNVSKNVIDKLA